MRSFLGLFISALVVLAISFWGDTGNGAVAVEDLASRQPNVLERSQARQGFEDRLVQAGGVSVQKTGGSLDHWLRNMEIPDFLEPITRPPWLQLFVLALVLFLWLLYRFYHRGRSLPSRPSRR